VLVKEMTVEECRMAMSNAHFGRLASARDGQPYVVPVSFAVDEEYAYLFSMPGQKVEWMRDNPRVCLEIDSVNSPSDWTSIVVLGQYEELPDTPEGQPARVRAQQLLQIHADWWQPGAVAVANRVVRQDVTPVIYRIHMERLTGRRGVPRTGAGARTPTRRP
jgi:nitroimidazol reductase NimA-like FMN-containing flavoprotein (pyridoxamine 5'-phosphate oxidase superfamily)